MPQHAAIGPVHLKPAQQQALAVLAENGSDFTRARYEEITGVSRSQAAYDLAELVAAGIVQRVGSGRATRYRLPREGGGSQRQWTSERIRAELETFCTGRESWPTPPEFRKAGRGDLYVAASRYGGIAHWARELGFPRETRETTSALRVVPEPARAARLRTKLAWAGAGALAALALAGAGALVVFHGRQAAPVDRHAAHATPPTRTADESIHPLRLAPSVVMKQRKAVRSTSVRRSTQRRMVDVRDAAPPRHATVAYHSAAPSRVTSGTTRAWSSTAGRTSAAPTPLAPPSGSGAPAPIKAP